MYNENILDIIFELSNTSQELLDKLTHFENLINTLVEDTEKNKISVLYPWEKTGLYDLSFEKILKKQQKLKKEYEKFLLKDGRSTLVFIRLENRSDFGKFT